MGYKSESHRGETLAAKAQSPAAPSSPNRLASLLPNPLCSVSLNPTAAVSPRRHQLSLHLGASLLCSLDPRARAAHAGRRCWSRPTALDGAGAHVGWKRRRAEGGGRGGELPPLPSVRLLSIPDFLRRLQRPAWAPSSRRRRRRGVARAELHLRWIVPSSMVTSSGRIWPSATTC